MTVTNPLAYPLEVTLRCAAPERWAATPAAFRLEPGASQAVELRLRVTRPPPPPSRAGAKVR